MRSIGARAYGVRLPIISTGDDLTGIAAECLAVACKSEGLQLQDGDVIGITEAIVAKAQGNYASIRDIAEDVKRKFGENPELGLVYPIFSRNRFLNILKGLSLGAKKLTVLLNYPVDEVGNPIIDLSAFYEIEDGLNDPVPADEFKKLSGGYLHPFTNVCYISEYQNAGDNIEIFFSRDPRDILKFTKNVIIGEIHSRNITKNRLVKAGAEKIFTLSDILSSPINGSGFNEDFGVLGSNMLKDDLLKLFPRDCEGFITGLRAKIRELSGASPEILIYGDGAFKDPYAGIWELADPVVSPAHTEKLGGIPDEIKLKFAAENVIGNLSGEGKKQAVIDMIKNRGKNKTGIDMSLGTTPRIYADLLGSLCDLVSGSGDKGTPVVLIKGYFDNYAEQ